MVLYDNIYDVEEYFGKPYPELIEFFKNWHERGHILDLGSGQGRDAIALASLGYKVTGVDVSNLGVEQMLSAAEMKGLNIEGKVEDMFQFKVSTEYDIVLLDSMLHLEKNDKKKELEFLKRIADELKVGGLLCVCIWKSSVKESLIKNIFKKSSYHWQIMNDSYLKYTFKDQKSDHKVDMEYNLLIIKKQV